MMIEKYLQNNKTWVFSKLEKDADYFKNLSKGQNPDVLIIGCSDSRVSLEQIMGADLGEFFIHRNIANQVNITDMNFLSVLEYAVNNLQIKHIIVFGHYECGGVKAAVEGDNHSLTENWVMPIRDIYQNNKMQLNLDSGDKTALYNNLAEMNVCKQAENIYKTSIMQRAKKEFRAPKVHAWIFDIYSGKIKELELK